MRCRLMYREGHLGACAINRAARGVNKMLDSVMATSLQNCKGAGHITGDITERLGQGISHSGLCSQVDDPLEPATREQICNTGLVCKVKLCKLEVIVTLKSFQSSVLQRYVVIIIEIVKTYDLVA